jgi:NadR type nicotinamide-nucleotide adenylyltransferase
MIARPFVVVVTGSECTGKTTLAQEIARQFEAPWSPEFVRTYLERKGAELDATDVDPIAIGQMAVENAAASDAADLLVKDTDLVSTAVYARHYYGACPAWIADAARERRGDLYLLLHPDVPWVADGLQRDRPVERDLLHGLFRSALAGIGARVIDITGTWEERRDRAFAAIRAAIRAAPGPVSR